MPGRLQQQEGIGRINPSQPTPQKPVNEPSLGSSIFNLIKSTLL